MNRRQKIVQEQFLNNEEEVIERLKRTYSQSLKDINGKISDLDSSIEYLQKVYNSIQVSDGEGGTGMGGIAFEYFNSKGANAAKHAALNPEEAKKTVASAIQSKVYQKNYQAALQKQVGGILDTMHEKEFRTVFEYLQKCYEDGFIGTMYDLQGQGIPLCFPLDQEAMVRAVQLDSKIKEGLYEHLGEDVKQLKKHITAQVSRGISTGMSFQQVAQQLSGKMIGTYENPGGSLAYAMRIARTEGHRIQVQGAMDACYKAKDMGADVVKQWDSTLDARTRESHQAVDGEIRELDKPFSNGLMFPGDPSGGAAEVVNCRCALLQRARWALDEDELETLKERAAYFGLDKADTFDDYKERYLKAANDPYGNMTFMQKKELIYTNEQKIDRLRKEKKQAELEGIMATSPDEVGAAFAKAKDIQKQIEELAVENDNIQKALGLPTNAKERFFAQNIDFKTLPHDIRPEDYDAISSWTRSEYVDINRYMRHGDKGVRPQSITYAHAIEECLDRNIVQEPFTVKRGINTKAMDNWFGGESWRKEGFNPNGAVIVDKGFCATTPALHGGFGGDVVAYIDVPAGAKGAYIADVSGSKNEEEFLLQSGTFFRFDRVDITYDKWNEPHYDVYLKVIVDEK